MNTTLSWHDPIVAEIHATRERLAEQYHDDLVAYSQAGGDALPCFGVSDFREPTATTECGRRNQRFVPQPGLPYFSSQATFIG